MDVQITDSYKQPLGQSLRAQLEHFVIEADGWMTTYNRCYIFDARIHQGTQIIHSSRALKSEKSVVDLFREAIAYVANKATEEAVAWAEAVERDPQTYPKGSWMN